MIPTVSWMVAADWVLLFFLSEHRWRFVTTPAVAAMNCGLSQSHANRRLKKLREAGLVELHDDRGYYRITDYGMRYMMGAIGAEELEERDPDKE